MKKKIIIGVVSALSAFVIFIAMCVGWFVYNNEYRLTLKGTELSPDGNYAITFQMVGTPEWPFGATTVKVTVKETETDKQIKVIDTQIHDDGAVLREYNWVVDWYSDSVQITLRGSEQEDNVYTVEL